MNGCFLPNDVIHNEAWCSDEASKIRLKMQAASLSMSIKSGAKHKCDFKLLIIYHGLLSQAQKTQFIVSAI